MVTLLTAARLLRAAVFAARRSNYSGVVLPPGPNTWPLNIPAAWPVPPILRLWSALLRSVVRLPHTAW